VSLAATGKFEEAVNITLADQDSDSLSFLYAIDLKINRPMYPGGCTDDLLDLNCMGPWGRKPRP
jgi:hypothetical protein